MTNADGSLTSLQRRLYYGNVRQVVPAVLRSNFDDLEDDHERLASRIASLVAERPTITDTERRQQVQNGWLDSDAPQVSSTAGEYADDVALLRSLIAFVAGHSTHAELVDALDRLTAYITRIERERDKWVLRAHDEQERAIVAVRVVEAAREVEYDLDDDDWRGCLDLQVALAAYDALAPTARGPQPATRDESAVGS